MAKGMTAPFVVDLVEVAAEDLPIAGGKAVNLGVMPRAGLPVPPGVCLPTAAYREVAGAARLDGVLDSPAVTPATTTDSLAALACRARDAILAAAMPDAVRESIVAAYERL